jgi:hypothetical protein
LAALTYSFVRSACPSGCGLPFERLQDKDWTGLFEHSLIFFRWVPVTHSIDEKANYLKYSTAPPCWDSIIQARTGDDRFRSIKEITDQ